MRTCLLKHDDCNHSYRFRNVGQNLLALSRSKLTVNGWHAFLENWEEIDKNTVRKRNINKEGILEFLKELEANSTVLGEKDKLAMISDYLLEQHGVKETPDDEAVREKRYQPAPFDPTMEANINITELILETMMLWFDSEYGLMNQELVNKFQVTDGL